MTQEERELLLKDLCVRLPYKVIVKTVGENKTLGLWDIRDVDNLPLPYLRSMSSMTEEEQKEYDVFCCKPYLGIDETTASNFIDWLNKHHFDYRGLIEKGLAIEAPGNMYSIK